MASEKSPKVGFGTFQGIFVPNVTMMFGVILFLRLGLVLGNVGLWPFIVIIAVSLGIMVLTSLSIATVVTNMNVGGGGVYYLISRSLGIEIGGAIGIALVLAQIISMTLCVSGFALSVHTLFPNTNLQLIELATMVILALLSSVSTNFALKTQIVIFGILMLSICSIFTGFTHVPNDPTAPFFSPPLTFWGGFALFYPALTGIEAGMALSGSLRNPSRSLSIGNIISLGFVSIVYLSVAIFLWVVFSKAELSSSPELLITASRFSPLVYIGIWAATLSSALGNFLGAPRILQRIAEDSAAPEIFSRTYGKYQEPRYALGIIFIIGLILVIGTTIDQILPILTMICLLTYGTLNVVAGLAELIGSPSWRPTFRIPWQYPILGGLLCFFLMLMIDPVWAIVSILLITGLYFYLRSKRVDVSFEDIRESIILFFSRIALYKLSGKGDNPKNWLPQVLIVSKSTVQHEKMVRIGYEITGRSGILTVATLLPKDWEESEELERTRQFIQDWLREKNIAGFTEVHPYSNYYESLQSLIRMHGVGPLQPNTILLPHLEENETSLMFQVLQTGQSFQKNILFFFDPTNLSNEAFSAPPEKRKKIDIWWDPNHKESFELILSLVLTLRTSPIWNFRELNLRTVVNDHNSKVHLKRNLSELLKILRLRCKVQIAVKENAPYTYVTKISSTADLVFFPLSPLSSFETDEECQNYLLAIKDHFSDTQVPIIAVSCNDSLDHREVYLPQAPPSS